MILLEKLKLYAPGVMVCAAIALGCTFLGQLFPLVGGPVFGILAGIAIALVWKRRRRTSQGISFTSKKVLQYAVILLGFGLNLAEVVRVGAQSLPVIISTIVTALLVAFVLCKALKIPERIATLVGVGSSICGGSAIAATAPVIKARDEEVAQAISVIFLFNVIAALVFPTLGTMLGLSNEGFALFAGTAINDTSSVTAAAAAWDGMHPGANTLDQATIVKLTRTLAIIPITFVLALWVARKERQLAESAALEQRAVSGEVTGNEGEGAKALHDAQAEVEEPLKTARKDGFSLKRSFPLFILWFLVASLITTIAVGCGVSADIFSPLKTLSKFFITMAMVAIGLNTDLVRLVKSGGKPILLGFCCCLAIAAVSLGMQAALGIW
ncbi:YeiH family protein [Anaerotardibacter muris]|uniref:YeiH family protein n=1 Tax=Anaerotardibacter muris TaxID=2941505 RepID=UPI0020424500|nr:YeiH family protein [Anaerotardibacter muris]